VTSCPVCATAPPPPFLQIPSAPVFCNVLWASEAEARDAPVGEIVLRACPRCGMVWNSAFDPSRVEYAPGYENSLHFSGVFQRYAVELADRLVTRHALRGRRIVEVGSGTGEFLALLCADGRNSGVGYDPSSTGDAAPGIHVVPEAYTEEHAAPDPPDFVVSRHVLEHVPDPLEFLRDLRAALDVAPEAILYVEVPAGDAMLREGNVWDVIYEHPSYFTAPALRLLFARAGFHVLAEGSGFGGQYRWIEAMPASTSHQPAADGAAVRTVAAAAAAFGEEFATRLRGWEERLPRHLENGGIALWGLGSKGVTFLTSVRAAAGINAVVDLNPRKHGRHVPLTGHVVAPPESLSETPVATVLALNPLYEAEIERSLAALGVQAKVVAA
jgi:SAM-dependent methyltransferase